MEWELRRLGERGEQDQSGDADVPRVTDEVQAAAEQFGQAGGPTGLPKQNAGGQERKATSPGDEQGL